jgi:hypothetical protein
MALPARATLLVLLLLPVPATAQAADDLVTDFERSGGKRTPTYEETLAYLGRLDRASEWIRVSTFGVSPEGRPLPLVVVDRHGRFTPARAHRDGNVVVLIQAGIHSGEIDGKDAGLLLVRAMAVERSLERLLDHATVLFIPIYNVDGHERSSPYNRANQNGPEVQGFRATSANLNLNRDYMKADAAETRAWLALVNEWQPDAFIDCHVTDGADYQYVVTYIAEVWQNADPGVAAWTAERFMPPLGARMLESGFPLSPYCDFRRGHDPRSGLRCWPSTPRFSTGYFALRNRPALLIETHMFKDYATRVRGTHEMLRHALAIINEEHRTLRAAVDEADRRTASAAFRREPFPVSVVTSWEDSVMIDFLGFDYAVETSDVTGGQWYRYSDTPRTFHIPYFHAARVAAAVPIPEAYVVPPQWTEVVERLRAHGVRCSVLDEPATLPVVSTRFDEVAWTEAPFEGRHPLSYRARDFEETRTFVAGSVVVDMEQPLAKVAAHLLEPAAADALVRWGFLDAAFEQKEYIESYVLEGVIREMLSADAGLASAFEEAKRDTSFARSPERVRRWFYERSPYFDTRMRVYPVGRIRERALIESLPLRER